MSDRREDKPVHKKAQTLADLWQCVVHPAFRIGFLDARAGRPFDHDKIVDRIQAETPAGALQRLGWAGLDLIDAKSFEVAQYRYEEGRTLFLEYGVRCKAWGHPDFPPAQVREFLIIRLKENSEQGD